jgi:hypothetical protein
MVTVVIFVHQITNGNRGINVPLFLSTQCQLRMQQNSLELSLLGFGGPAVKKNFI